MSSTAVVGPAVEGLEHARDGEGTEIDAPHVYARVEARVDQSVGDIRLDGGEEAVYHARGLGLPKRGEIHDEPVHWQRQRARGVDGQRLAHQVQWQQRQGERANHRSRAIVGYDRMARVETAVLPQAAHGLRELLRVKYPAVIDDPL
jgi:hypothetical protein